MNRNRIFCLLLAAICTVGAVGIASAAEVDCDDTYCFSPEDFSDEQIVGICVTGLPDSDTGTVMLGTRVICIGDILTDEQVSQMTFVPLKTQTDTEAVLTYLPIYEDRVAQTATMKLCIRGKTDHAPVAEDQAMETYKNLPNSAPLKVTDPEGEALTYTVTRQPKRGTVEIDETGNFTYTPKKNKVGTDSFTYTATDPAGNVSREATVTITVLKPADARQYADTVGSNCRFEAEWLKNTGLFTGETIADQLVFHENATVSRGEFLALAMKVLNIPIDDTDTTAVYEDEIPIWLQPYLAAALRSGLMNGWSSTTFGAADTVTGNDAAVILQNALDLSVSTAALETVDEEIPDWAAVAVAAMAENGINLNGKELTRGDMAILLYRVSKLTASAPGLQMYQ